MLFRAVKTTKTVMNLMATIHFSPFTCCFRKFFRRSFMRFFSATRTPNSQNHSYVHYSLSKFTGEWFTNHSNHIHRFTPITRKVATKVMKATPPPPKLKPPPFSDILILRTLLRSMSLHGPLRVRSTHLDSVVHNVCCGLSLHRRWANGVVRSRTHMGSDGLNRILLFQPCRGTSCTSENT